MRRMAKEQLYQYREKAKPWCVAYTYTFTYIYTRRERYLQKGDLVRRFT